MDRTDEKSDFGGLKISIHSNNPNSRTNLSETSSLLHFVGSELPRTEINKPKTVKLYYGTKKIKLPTGGFYLYSKPYYCNPMLYKEREEIYKLNRKMLEENTEYEVVFLTDDVKYPYKEVDEKERLTVNDEKFLIKKYASALNDDDAREALRDMWKLQTFCDLIIKSEKGKYYLVHQIIFCHYSPLLRIAFSKNRELIRKVEALEINDIAIQQMIQFLYSKKLPTIDTSAKFVNLMSCARVFMLPELEKHLVMNVPSDLRIFKSNYKGDEKYQKCVIDFNNYNDAFKNTFKERRLTVLTIRNYTFGTPKLIKSVKDLFEKKQKNKKPISGIQSEQNIIENAQVELKNPLLCRLKMNANLILNTNAGSFKVSTNNPKI